MEKSNILYEKKFQNQSFWGWGYQNLQIPTEFYKKLLQNFESLGITGYDNPYPEPNLNQIKLREPRFNLPENIQKFCKFDKKNRLRHTYGRSTREILLAIHGIYDCPPDYIAFPQTEQQIIILIEYCSKNNIALTTFGGGSSVVGGVTQSNEYQYKGNITLNMLYFNKMIQVNKQDQTAHFQCGIYGPELEKQLNQHDVTFRHFPQSFEFSTLGGWIATRSAGHFATGRTHVDSCVQSLKIITPSGIIETSQTPVGGTGPNINNIFIGSEGLYGIITEASIRVLQIPKFKISTKIFFEEFYDGIQSMRQIIQSELNPSNLRIYDRLESFAMELSDGQFCVLQLGFESTINNEINQQKIKICQDICKQHKGQFQEISNQSDEQFRSNFTMAPYLRNHFLRYGIISETFETVINWTKFQDFHQTMIQQAQQAILEIFGAGTITCRITHSYTDGIAPYFTIIAQGQKDKEIQQWDKIKKIVSDLLVQKGALITHHHSIGRDHAQHYIQQNCKNGVNVLKNIKKQLDPHSILNPGLMFHQPKL